MKSLIVCPVCGAEALIENSAIGRARRIVAPLYCGRVCAGIARRDPSPRTEAQRKADKAAYDREYRVRDVAAMKAAKAEYHRRTYNAALEAEKRRLKMPRHVEYCRQPEYKAWKKEYDKRYRAQQDYGEYWEASIVCNEIATEVLTRTSRYEIGLERGTLGKTQQRRRDYDGRN